MSRGFVGVVRRRYASTGRWRVEERMDVALERRRVEGRLRCPQASEWTPAVDFASNDYLGLGRSVEVHREAMRAEWHGVESQLNGSTGSRLLTGCSRAHDDLEAWLADFHGTEAALLFGSGYAANAGTMACLATERDAVVYDSLSHNSTRFGLARGRQRTSRSFAHNDADDLARVLRDVTDGVAFVCVESIYSMDGDAAPLEDLAAVCLEHGNACLVVDEAHATGVVHGGRGAVHGMRAEFRDVVLCAIHTFGKAVGCHGAAALGSKTLSSYLANYAQPFVYSTALPPAAIRLAARCYEHIAGSDGDARRTAVERVATELRARLAGVADDFPDVSLVPSASPIHALVVPGPQRAVAAAAAIKARGFDVGAIRAPTVPPGTERLRIIAHAHNTLDDVAGLADAVRASLAVSSSHNIISAPPPAGSSRPMMVQRSAGA